MLDDECPLGQRQPESGQSPVAAGHRVAHAHQQQEANPVEQERHCNQSPRLNHPRLDITIIGIWLRPNPEIWGDGPANQHALV